MLTEGLAAPAASIASEGQLLGTLARLSRSMAAAAGLRPLLRSIAQGVVELFDPDRVTVVLNCDDVRLQLRAGRAHGKPPIERFAPASAERIQRRLEHHLGTDFHQKPLEAAGRTLGTIAFSRDSDRPLAPVQQEALSLLADHAAALVQAMLASRQHRSVTPLEILEDPQQRQTVMSGLAHNMRTPILAVHFACNLLESYHGNDPKQLATLEHLRTAARHLKSITDNIVDVGRSASGQLPVECQEMDLLETVGQAVSLVATEAAACGKGIVGPPAQRLSAWADPQCVCQIVVNLLHNAIKYSPAKSEIRLRVEAARGHLLLHVSDHGPGIDQEHWEAIFRPYYRVRDDSAGCKPGVGLGLAISRYLARQMGGELSLSTAPAAGTTFTLQLPACQEAVDA